VTTRRLVLVRHAKAMAEGGVDTERGLTSRGEADASGIGAWLANQHLVPDRVVVSPARRALRTWELAADALGGAASPVVDERVYRNTVEDLLAAVRDTPADIGTLVLVGHNPSVEEFATALDDGAGDATGRRQLAEKYPTSGIAVFDIGTDWADVDTGAATLASFATPGDEALTIQSPPPDAGGFASPGPVPAPGRPDFDAMYAGTPPWDIGRPQPALLALADAGELQGRVLDVGCGTGEHALMAASRGLAATGVDTSPTAIAIAQRKAAERGLAARFVVWDALDLAELGEQFDVVLDCGLFHVFSDDDRDRYTRSLRAVVPIGGRYHMVCFSDRQPGDFGPRRVSQDEIRAAFAEGWRVDSIQPATLEIQPAPAAALSWLATITRT
jgi:phosphohistidine phosphatase SixA/SAM-dependent methyltransferase